MYAGNTPGLQTGGGYDSSLTSGQQNPLVAGQGVNYGDVSYQSATGAKQVGPAGSASNQMNSMLGSANDNVAGPQQQGVASNAQGRNCVHQLI